MSTKIEQQDLQQTCSEYTMLKQIYSKKYISRSHDNLQLKLFSYENSGKDVEQKCLVDATMQ